MSLTRETGATPPDHRSDQRPQLPERLYIYFFGTEDGTEIKVGRARKPHIRKDQHENVNGRHEPLVWLAVLKGDEADERTIKNLLAPHRSPKRPKSKEWFDAHAEPVRSYVRFIRDQYFVCCEDADMKTLEALPLVPSSDWLPNGRRLKAPTQLTIPIAGDPWSDLDTSEVMEGDFYTHRSIIEAARGAMGGIDVDPASCAQANEVVRATTFFGAKENGLLHDWIGNVWLNPPFGNFSGEWAPTLLYQWKSGRVNQMCVLASTRAITAQGFHGVVQAANAMWVAYGRLPFWGPNAKSPDEGHVVFYFGDRVAEFIEAFEISGLGTVYLRKGTE